MKLRIRGNSLRIRLTRSEVDTFAKTGYLEDKTSFPGDELAYALEAKPAITGLEASFENNRIVLYVPAGIPVIWAANEVVGYENTVDTRHGNKLFLLLEKDFKCIDAPPYEDQSDNFENPNKVC